jgi:AcrR family transcriptional regulator
MQTKSKTDDRRASRTRQALSGALVELIKERHYDEIRVQDVLDRANVGRSTFYAHYRDKEDLFRSGWERLLDAVVGHIAWKNIEAGRVVPVMELFRHVEDFQLFCKGLVRSRKMDSLYKSGTIYVAKSVETSLTSFLKDKPQPSVPLSILSNHLASTLFALLGWWLDNNMRYPPERMDEMFHQLVMPGLREAFANIELAPNSNGLPNLMHSSSGRTHQS